MSAPTAVRVWALHSSIRSETCRTDEDFEFFESILQQFPKLGVQHRLHHDRARIAVTVVPRACTQHYMSYKGTCQRGLSVLKLAASRCAHMCIHQ
jgi:hypothetical protein